jgi:hypothetical protein
MAVSPISSRMVALRPRRPKGSPGQAGFCPWNSSDVPCVCLTARTLRAESAAKEFALSADRAVSGSAADSNLGGPHFVAWSK